MADWLEKRADELGQDDSWLDKAAATSRRGSLSRVRANIQDSFKTEPQALSNAIKASKKLNVPIDFAERNKEVQQLASEEEIYRKLRNTELVRKAFENPDFAKLARDDVDSLSLLEMWGTDLKRGAQRVGATFETISYLIDNAISSVGSKFLPDPKYGGKPELLTSAGALKLASDALQETGENPLFAELSQRMAGEEDVLDQIGTGFKYLAEEPGLAVSLLAEQLPGLAAFGPVGVGAAGPARAAVLSKVRNKALERYLSVAMPAATTQMVTNYGLTLGPEVASGISQGMTTEKAIARAQVKALTEGTVNAMGGFLPFPEATTRFGRAGMVAAEAVKQGAFGASGAAAAAVAVGEEIDPGELFLEFIGEGITSPVDMTIAAIADPEGAAPFLPLLKEHARAMEAEAIGNVIDNAVEASLNSNLRTLDEDSFNQVAKEIFGEETEEIRLRAEDAAEFFQNTPEALELVREKLPEVAANFQESMTIGGDVIISAKDYVTYLPEYHQSLQDKIIVGPDGMSRAEAQQLYEQSAEQFKKQADEVLSEKQERELVEANANEVYKSIKEQIVATGRFTEDAASSYAELHKAFAITMADRLGTTPAEVYKTYGLEVLAPSQEAAPPSPPGEVEGVGAIFDEAQYEQAVVKAEKEHAKKLKRVKVKYMETVRETGEEVEITETADKALSRTTQRMESLKQMLECIRT